MNPLRFFKHTFVCIVLCMKCFSCTANHQNSRVWCKTIWIWSIERIIWLIQKCVLCSDAGKQCWPFWMICTKIATNSNAKKIYKCWLLQNKKNREFQWVFTSIIHAEKHIANNCDLMANQLENNFYSVSIHLNFASMQCWKNVRLNFIVRKIFSEIFSFLPNSTSTIVTSLTIIINKCQI